jgi:hypothetical protein
MGESKCFKKVPSFLALLRSGEYLRSSCWARNCSVMVCKLFLGSIEGKGRGEPPHIYNRS